MISACDKDPLYGISTDSLPTNASNGQKLVLIDTGAEKYFDEETGEWLPE